MTAKRTIAQIQGPTATHFASGRCLPILNDVVETGTMIVGVSVDEDLRELKKAAGGRVSILGKLNGIKMRRWTASQAEKEVKNRPSLRPVEAADLFSRIIMAKSRSRRRTRSCWLFPKRRIPGVSTL